MKNPRSWLVLAMLVVEVCGGCGPSARRTAIRDAFTATQAAQVAFVTYDRDHQLAIVADAPTETVARDRIAAYRLERDRVVAAFDMAWRSIAAAATADDEPSFAGMLRALSLLSPELKTIGVTQ